MAKSRQNTAPREHRPGEETSSSWLPHGGRHCEQRRQEACRARDRDFANYMALWISFGSATEDR